MAQPVAGDVVGLLPGVGVRLPSSPDIHTAAFNPTNSGTPTRPIVYVTRYAAIGLTTPESNPNRTEFRHDGSAPTIVNGIGAGTGGAMLGANARNHIIYDGFFIDMAQAYIREDSGVLRPELSVGVHFKNFVIKGATLTVASNAVVYRPQGAQDTVLSNFRVFDFLNNPTGSATPQGSLFSDQYGDRNFLIEHFELHNTGSGIFPKGTANGSMFNYGTIRYGVISQVSNCFRFNALDATQPTTVAYVLCHDVAYAGVAISSETIATRNLSIHHVTVAKLNSSNINANGGLASYASGFGVNVTLRDNLIDVDNGRFGHGVDFGAISSLPAVLDYNGYFKNGANVTWAFNGGEYSSLGTWQTTTARDAHSVVLTSSPFVDRAAGTYRIAPGHPASTASSTGGPLGAYAGPEVPGAMR